MAGEGKGPEVRCWEKLGVREWWVGVGRGAEVGKELGLRGWWRWGRSLEWGRGWEKGLRLRWARGLEMLGGAVGWERGRIERDGSGFWGGRVGRSGFGLVGAALGRSEGLGISWERAG